MNNINWYIGGVTSISLSSILFWIYVIYWKDLKKHIKKNYTVRGHLNTLADELCKLLPQELPKDVVQYLNIECFKSTDYISIKNHKANNGEFHTFYKISIVTKGRFNLIDWYQVEVYQQPIEDTSNRFQYMQFGVHNIYRIVEIIKEINYGKRTIRTIPILASDRPYTGNTSSW